MIIVDIETTGTDPKKSGILSIGAIHMRDQDIRFYMECRAHEGADINPSSLAVNGVSLDEVFSVEKKSEEEALLHFSEWLKEHNEFTIAGQNVFFDRAFLQAGFERNSIPLHLSARIIDLHSVAYAHMESRGTPPPTKDGRSALGTDEVMQYVGLPPEPKPHNALNGALYEAEAFHRLLYHKNYIDDFKKYPLPHW